MATVAFEAFVETLRHDDTLSLSPMRVADALSLPLQDLAATAGVHRKLPHRNAFASPIIATVAVAISNPCKRLICLFNSVARSRAKGYIRALSQIVIARPITFESSLNLRAPALGQAGRCSSTGRPETWRAW
jgi:hypothetical protein